MKILITNDDGIESPGLHILAEVLSLRHEVTVVAPDNECSGMSHAINLFRGITMREYERIGYKAYSISGTPIDCIKFGIYEILKNNRPDAVVSGINNLPNLGTDMIYSGTVNAALDGAICGVKSVALSVSWDKDEDYRFVAEFTDKNLEKLLSMINTDIVLNINFPSGKKAKINGVRFTDVGKTDYNFFYVKTEDEGLTKYYHLLGYPVPVDNNEFSDTVSDKVGFITITPIKVNLTDYAALEEIRSHAAEIVL